MANELIVSIKADTSGLGPGLADATGQVASAAASMASATGAAASGVKTLAAAQEQATAASKNLKAAMDALGASAKLGNASAQEVIAGYQAEVTAAEAVVASLREQEVSTKAATAANREFAVSGQQAALGGVRVLEGSLMGSSRAAGMFLSNTLGLGSVLSAAFPVIGALAMGEVLIDVGGELIKFTQEARDLSDTLGVGWLQAAVLEMAGFGNEVKKEEAELVKLEAEHDKFISQQKAAQLTTLGASEGRSVEEMARAEAYHQEATRLEALLPSMREKLALEQALANSPYLKQLASDPLTGAIAAAVPDPTGNKISGNANLAAEQARVQQAQIAATEAEIQALRSQATALITTVTAQQPKDKAKGSAGATDNLPQQIARASIEAAHAMDSELNPAQEITAQLQKQLDLNLAKERSSKEGTQAEREKLRALEDQTAMGKANAALSELEGVTIERSFDRQQKDQEETAKREAELQRRNTEDFKRNREEMEETAKQTAEASIEAVRQTFEFTERQIRSEEELGIISHRVATQRLEDAIKLEGSQTQKALGKEKLVFDPVEGGKELQEHTAVENKMVAEARKTALQMEQVQQQAAQKFEQQWKKAAQVFNSDFTQAFNAWATHSETAGQAFGHMLGQMELQVADFVAEWLLKQAELWLMQKIMQVTGLTSQAATQRTANTATITADAGVAYAGTLAYYSAINPPAAPALAAAQAATTSAGGLAYEVFDTGGMLPSMSMAFNKSGAVERVLSPSQTQNFESLVNNGGSPRATLNQTNHFGGGVTQEMLASHTSQTMAKMRNMMRPEAFK